MLTIKSKLNNDSMTDQLQILNGDNLILSWLEETGNVKGLSLQLKRLFDINGIECIYIDNENHTAEETPATDQLTIHYNYDNIIVYYNRDQVLAWHCDFCFLSELYDQLLELFQLLKIEYVTGK